MSRRDNAVYRDMMSVTAHVAEAALGGADVTELTRVFAEIAGRSVVVLDARMRLRASAAAASATPPRWDPDDVVTGRLLSALAADRRPLRVPALPGTGELAYGCVATPIAIGEVVLGYLVLLVDDATQDSADDLDLLVASYAASLFALTLSHESTTTDLGLRYQAAVVDSLVSGHFLDAADARRKALSIGLPSNVPFRVGLVRLGAGADPGALEEAMLEFVAARPDVIVAGRGGEIVVVVPEPDGRPDRDAGPAAAVLGEIAERARKAGLDPCPTCGLSERAARPDLAPRAFEQAGNSIEIGERLGRGGGVVATTNSGYTGCCCRSETCSSSASSPRGCSGLFSSTTPRTRWNSCAPCRCISASTPA